MEDGEEEEYDDNYVPSEYGDATEHQEEPDDMPDDDDLRRALSMQGRNAKVKRRS